MSKIFLRLKQEFLNMIPVAIFFFIAFQLLAFTKSLILLEYDIEVSAFVAATVGALVVAKVVLIVDLLPIVNRYPDKPAMYNVVWKTVIYMTAAFAFRYLEHFVRYFIEYRELATAHANMLAGVVWPHFWVVQIWLFVLFFMYSVQREFVRLLGVERVRAMFLGMKGPKPVQQ